MYLGFWLFSASKPASLLEVDQKCASEVSKSGQMLISLPKEPDWVVLDAPAGFQGYKLTDYLRLANKVIIPVVPSVFDMAATEDFLASIRQDMRGRHNVIGIVAMRVDPRTRAAAMLEEFLKHFDIPILSYIRNTQNYVNAAARGLTVFDPPRSRHQRDVEQWEAFSLLANHCHCWAVDGGENFLPHFRAGFPSVGRRL
jgi:cellulose biosynthesis protein BcsQ